jgi:hypothetical protein
LPIDLTAKIDFGASFGCIDGSIGYRLGRTQGERKGAAAAAAFENAYAVVFNDSVLIIFYPHLAMWATNISSASADLRR